MLSPGAVPVSCVLVPQSQLKNRVGFFTPCILLPLVHKLHQSQELFLACSAVYSQGLAKKYLLNEQTNLEKNSFIVINEAGD